MSTGRKSQLEKFEARQRKARGVAHHIQEKQAKEAYQEQHKSIIERGEDLAVKATKGAVQREDIYAVMTREGMDMFMNMWNNSMENTIRATMKDQIRPMIREVVQEVVQEEMAAAIKGVFSGMSEAMSPPPLFQEIAATVEDEQPSIDEVFKQKRVGKVRVPKCGACGESGHNKRTCPTLA